MGKTMTVNKSIIYNIIQNMYAGLRGVIIKLYNRLLINAIY